jgi:hypothetical protein
VISAIYESGETNQMTYLSFLPLATFAGIALTVAIISACIAFTERRRERNYVQRRRPMFRPVIIQGGKMDIAQVAPPAVPENSNAKPAARARSIRWSVLP